MKKRGGGNVCWKGMELENRKGGVIVSCECQGRK